jgi:hypothetical protein
LFKSKCESNLFVSISKVSVEALTVEISSFQQLLAARILLGVAEAGFYPGVVY